jgi:hypothetical protein
MSEHQDNSNSSSSARHVSFSELVHVIAFEDENGYEDPPTIMENLNESDSELSVSELSKSPSSETKHYDCNEAPSSKTEDLDLGEGLQSFPNLSYDDGSCSEESININEFSDKLIREVPAVTIPALQVYNDDDLDSYRNDKQLESDGWGSRLFASFGYISFIASCAGILGCLSSCFCLGQRSAVDYDDAVGSIAFALNADKSVVFTSLTGDGGATYVTYVCIASFVQFETVLFLRQN